MEITKNILGSLWCGALVIAGVFLALNRKYLLSGDVFIQSTDAPSKPQPLDAKTKVTAPTYNTDVTLQPNIRPIAFKLEAGSYQGR